MGYVDFHKHDTYKRSKNYDMQFRRRFEKSQKQSEKFDDIYYKIYKNLNSIENVENIRSYQKIGIDKILITDEKHIAVDEKITNMGVLLAKLCYKFLRTDFVKSGWVYYSKADYVSVMYHDYIYHIPMKPLRKYIDSNFHNLRARYYATFIDNDEIEVSCLNIPLDTLSQDLPEVQKFKVGSTQKRLI